MQPMNVLVLFWNHRIRYFRSNQCRLSSSAFSSKQLQSNQVAQCFVQPRLNMCKDQFSRTSLSNLSLYLPTPIIKWFFLIFKSISQLVATCMVCLLSYHCVTFENLSSLHPTIKQRKTAVRSSFTLLLLRLKRARSQPLIVFHVLQPLTILVALHRTSSSLSVSFLYWEPQPVCSTPDGCHKCRIKRRMDPFDCSPANTAQEEGFCRQGTWLVQITGWWSFGSQGTGWSFWN